MRLILLLAGTVTLASCVGSQIQARAGLSGMNSGYTPLKIANDSAFDLTHVRVTFMLRDREIRLKEPVKIPAGKNVVLPLSDFESAEGGTSLVVEYSAWIAPIRISCDQGEWSGDPW